jgi:tRNA A-37 threonylcarbamoyl transferase component Bud32
MDRHRPLRLLFASIIGVLLGLGCPHSAIAQTDHADSKKGAAYSDADFEAYITDLESALGRTLRSAGPPDENADPAAGLPATDPGTLHERAESGFRQILRTSLNLLPLEIDRAFRDLRSGNWTRDVQTIVLGLLSSVLVVLLALRMLRGHGDVVVSIHYPAELRGTFNVRISKKKIEHSHRRIADAMNPNRSRNQAIAATRFEHTMVSRETRFREIPARRYCVMVYGYLQPMGGETILATHLDEHEVRVCRGHTERLDFDFRPTECVLEVSVLWDRQPVGEALVAARAAPESLRYTRGGPVRLTVGRGRHTVVVGSGDRVAEHEVDITSFQPTSVSIDLSGRDQMLFSGCPPAVEPYLHGDFSAAARALERDGQIEVAHLIWARLHQERGQKQTAAEHYEAAGRPLEAAELYQALDQFAPAAELFEQVGQLARAGEMWRAAGQHSRAGEAYERANRLDAAVECYREAGDVSRWAAVLERNGAPLDAARVAIDHDDWGRAIRSLQLVPESDPAYITATDLLIDAYQRAGHLDMALHKCEELVNHQGIEQAPLESCERLATLLEESEEFERSLSVLEVMRQRDASYPNVATRIEELRKRVSQEATTGTTPAFTDVFGSGFRYEILEEVGRGGMGVVYRARDRRLERVVALKQLPKNLRNHPKAVALFLREARSAAVLNHPNIVTVYDAGQENDILYITMELLQGMPLQQILRSRGKLTSKDTARLGIQIAKGLQYAHEQHIIHRDIKTGNLFFTDSKKVKIMDFGLAKMVEEVGRGSTVIGGTPFYMAPEQGLGDSIDHRADLYALGVTLYELSTGTVPFSEGDVAYHHRHTTPPDPREKIEEMPAALAELILQLLAKTPTERCESAQEVSERLQPLSLS